MDGFRFDPTKFIVSDNEQELHTFTPSGDDASIFSFLSEKVKEEAIVNEDVTPYSSHEDQANDIVGKYTHYDDYRPPITGHFWNTRIFARFLWQL